MGLCISSSKRKVSGSSSHREKEKEKEKEREREREKEKVKGKSHTTTKKSSGLVAAAAHGKRSNFGYDRDFDHKYTIGKLLGHGQFGYTYVATHKHTAERVAVKRIEKKKMLLPIAVEDVKREVKILQALNGHENVVQFHNAFEDDDFVYIVMELCEGGELLDRILAKKDSRYSEKDAAKIVRQMLKVAARCHLHGVVHRDLKPENFLFKSIDKDSPLKATDFGLSDFIKPGKKFQDIVGSAYYVAPEVLKRKSGPESDVWSIGVITYILLCGRRPFWDKTEDGIFKEVLRKKPDFREKPWASVSSSAKDFVKKLLVKDPRARLTAAQALSHPWAREGGEASEIPLDISVLCHMREFVKYSRLKQFALRALASTLGPEELADLRDQFDAIDIDKSGSITLEEIRQVAETRFASNTIVLRRLIKVKDALTRMVTSANWTVWRQSNSDRATIIRGLILNESWWDRAEYLLKITEPILTMIRYTDMDRPCLGEVYDGIDSMIEDIRNIVNEKEQDPDEKFFKELQLIMIERWNKMTTPLHLLAFALSPRFYSQSVLKGSTTRVPPYRDPEVAQGYKAALRRLFLEHLRPAVRAEFMSFASTDDCGIEALEDKNNANAHKWWFYHGEKYQHLQPIAIKILSQALAKDQPWTVKESRVLEILQAMDSNRDGLVDFDEFVAATLHVHQLEEHDSEKWQQRSKSAFEKFDFDRDGYITPEELRMHTGLKGSIEPLLDEADIDRDGKISLFEFQRLLRTASLGPRTNEYNKKDRQHSSKM